MFLRSRQMSLAVQGCALIKGNFYTLPTQRAAVVKRTAKRAGRLSLRNTKGSAFKKSLNKKAKFARLKQVVR